MTDASTAVLDSDPTSPVDSRTAACDVGVQGHDQADRDDRIPVTVLTGFLGSGKTTLLNHWMQQPGMQGVAVLVNEFGEVGIDHHLIEGGDDNMVLLDSGCLCCQIRGDLVQALQTLSLRASRGEIASLTRIIVETSGLADPIPIVYTLMDQRFCSARFRCDGVIVAVATTHGLQQLQRHPETLRQAVAADHLLITKVDLGHSAELQALQARLHSLNPQASQTLVRHGRAPLDALITQGLYGTSGDRVDRLSRWLGTGAGLLSHARMKAGDAAHTDADFDAQAGPGTPLQSMRARARYEARHSHGVESFIVDLPGEVPWFGLALTIGQIQKDYSAQILRIKGLVGEGNDRRPLAVHCVQDVAYPPVRLSRWPDDAALADGSGQLVFITQGLTAEAREAIQHRLSHLPADRLALRTAAVQTDLSTRCWMQQRVAVQPSHGIRHRAWVITMR